MIGAISPYAVIVLIALLIVALAVVWLCSNAMRSGSDFEGEIGNRWVSMKLRTKPPPLSPGDTAVSAPPREREATDE